MFVQVEPKKEPSFLTRGNEQAGGSKVLGPPRVVLLVVSDPSLLYFDAQHHLSSDVLPLSHTQYCDPHHILGTGLKQSLKGDSPYATGRLVFSDKTALQSTVPTIRR